MTKLLLEQVGAHMHLFDVQQHKTVWKMIVTALNSKGYNVNTEQCNNKWKSLKKRYKTIKDHNKQSGASKHYWTYFDAVDAILRKLSEVAPLSLASSTDGFRVYVDSDEEEDNENNPEKVLHINNNLKTYRSTKSRNNRKVNEPYWAKELRMQRERHHKENLQQKERFLSLLEKRHD